MMTMKMTASVHWYVDNDDEDDNDNDHKRDDKEKEKNERNSDHNIMTMTRQVLLKI